jgi:hypothetical protein
MNDVRFVKKLKKIVKEKVKARRNCESAREGEIM